MDGSKTGFACAVGEGRSLVVISAVAGEPMPSLVREQLGQASRPGHVVPVQVGGGDAVEKHLIRGDRPRARPPTHFGPLVAFTNWRRGERLDEGAISPSGGHCLYVGIIWIS